jgi:hypothetical protein
VDKVIQLSEREEAKALPILLRKSPGVALRNRTYVLSQAAIDALRQAGVTFRKLSRNGIRAASEGITNGVIPDSPEGAEVEVQPRDQWPEFRGSCATNWPRGSKAAPKHSRLWSDQPPAKLSARILGPIDWSLDRPFPVLFSHFSKKTPPDSPHSHLNSLNS